jgi:hypothetical protein
MWEIEIQAGNNTRTICRNKILPVGAKSMDSQGNKGICMVLTSMLGWLITHRFDEDHHF